MIFIFKLDFEFDAENFDEARKLVAEVAVGHPEAMIQTQESLVATEESLIEFHESKKL